MYDEIANLYHLVYEDWDAAIDRQAAALDGLFRERIGPPPHSVLDVSCGIGTQALGLAARNYKVTASDLSHGAVARARREASQRGLEIEFSVADMRECAGTHSGEYDVVLSADNSIPHLPSQTEVTKALDGFYRCLRPGGIAVVGVRDYSPDEGRKSPQMCPYGFREHEGDRYFVFQTRDWQDDTYRVAMYFVREANGDRAAEVTAGVSQYYPVGIGQVMSMLGNVGFDDVRHVDKVLHQPVIVGRRPGG
jgi:SAM-dependent methyltransferase